MRDNFFYTLKAAQLNQGWLEDKETDAGLILFLRIIEFFFISFYRCDNQIYDEQRMWAEESIIDTLNTVKIFNIVWKYGQNPRCCKYRHLLQAIVTRQHVKFWVHFLKQIENEFKYRNEAFLKW